MNEKSKKTKILFIVILLLTISISIGYALLGQELTTTGITNFDNASWNIHFVGNPTDSFNESIGSVNGTHSYSSNYKSLSFSDTLSIPGDYYEFTVDITNDGNIDGMLNSVPTIGIIDNKGTSDISDDTSYSNTTLISSTITYNTGGTLSQYDELKVGDTLTYKIRIEFKKDIQNSDLENLPLHLTFTLEPTYVQADSNATNVLKINESIDCDGNLLYATIPNNINGLAKIMAEQSVLDNSKSLFVNNCSGVKFNEISSDTNGKGVYEIASTKDDTYPIYYYRGAVTNNNVLFANFCWKAVRTTDTGGVKLIYNGTPTNGQCTNTTGDATQIRTSSFNSYSNSPAYVGYMYGSIYTYSNITANNLNTSYIYGNDVTWDGTNYTLTDTITSSGTWSSDYNTLNNNHYTCFTTSNTCTSVYYIYYADAPAGAFYITLSNGKKEEDAFNDMFTNENDSIAKTNVDTWYSNNMTSYTNKIEDTIYCNDRSINLMGGWNPNGGYISDHLYFNGRKRKWATNEITLNCTREIDKFTVSNVIGNGKLTYPVGLITVDEIIYAGISSGNNLYANNTYYLYTNKTMWTMTPGAYTGSTAYEFHANSSSNLDGLITSNSSVGLRPVVSLAPTNFISQGDGTSLNPYIIE